MPYLRKKRYTTYGRSSYKRRRYTATPWYKKKYNAMEIASKGYTLAKQLASIINSEKHYIDYNTTNNPTNAGNIVNIVQVAQGDGSSGRTGNSILVKRIQFNITCYQNTSAAQTNTRVIIFQDMRQVADTTPAVTDVLATASPVALLNGDNDFSNRWKVLWDKQFVTSDIGDDYKQSFGNEILLNTHIKYNGSATSDINQGGIYVLFISDQATNTPTVANYFRVDYYDN